MALKVVLLHPARLYKVAFVTDNAKMTQTTAQQKIRARWKLAAVRRVITLSPPEWAAVIVSVLFLLWLVLKPVPPFAFKSVANAIGVMAPLLASFWCLITAGRAPQSKQRLAATFLGLGLLSESFGQAIWFWYEIVLRRDCPFPSWGDTMYLLYYPLVLAGIMCMPRVPILPAMRGRMLLDALIVMTSMVTFSWYFVLGPTLLKGSETLAGKIIGAAYPLADLVLLFCLFVLSAQDDSGFKRRATVLIWLGLVTVITVDSLFAYRTLQGTYQSGDLMDIGWVLSDMLVGAGGCVLLHSRRRAVKQKQNETIRKPVLWRSLAPYTLVPAVAALLAFTVTNYGDEPLELGVWICSAVLLSLLLLRQVFAIVENNKLFTYLQEAYREMEDVKVMLEVQNRSLEDANDRLENLATTDSLTGLINHRAFHERLEEAWAQYVLSGQPLSLILLDVDSFKQYNDTYGHPAGDDVLKVVAQVLASACRAGDLAARHGGEEYALILPQTHEQEAVICAERIRAALEHHPWPRRRITASLGIATINPAVRTPNDLIVSADAALYQSKANGRNRVTVASMSVSVG